MRKIYMMLAAALVVLAADSCNKDNVSDAPAQDSMVVKFTANVAGTKAVFNPSSYEDGSAVPVLWNAGDELRMYVNEKVFSKLPDLVGVNLPNGAECSESATWTHDFAPTYDPISENYVGHMPEAPFTFYAFCPGASMRGFYSGEQQRIRINTIPSEQTPEQNTCDPEAMCIYSISETYDVWPEEVEMPEFRHMTAYGCITLGSGIPETAVVEKVKITANEGQYLAGDAWYYYAGEKEGLWEDYKANSRTETITIKTAFKENIWFGCCPTTDLKSLTVEVYTETGECYVVEKAIPAGKNFEAGKIAKMTVTGFENVEPGKITYIWTADDESIGFITGKTNDIQGLTWNDKVVSQTFIAGSPVTTDWVVNATATANYNITNNAVSESITAKRLKIGSKSDLFNPVTLNITPLTGYKVKTITVYASVNSEANKYKISANVGGVTFIEGEALKATKAPEAFTASVTDAVEGQVEIKFSGETSDVFYLYKVEIEFVN